MLKKTFEYVVGFQTLKSFSLNNTLFKEKGKHHGKKKKNNSSKSNKKKSSS